MVSNTIGVASKSEILSGIYAVDGIDRSGQSHSSGFPVIGKRGGFTGFKIARHEKRGRSLTIPAKQDEQDHNGEPLRRNDINDIVARSLRSRRIESIKSFIRPFLFYPLLLRPHKLQRRCWTNSRSAHLSLSSHCSRTRVVGELVVFVQTGKITPGSRRRRSLKATKKEKGLAKKIVSKENARQVGHGMIIGGKAIFPESDLVLFQLCLGHYANHGKNVNHPARQGGPSQYGPLRGPSCDRDDQTMTLCSENNQDRIMDCSEGCSGRCGSGCCQGCCKECCPGHWPEGAGREGKSPWEYPCSFNGSCFVGKGNDSGFVMDRKFRFGFWNIKLLTALLLFLLLISVLDAFTGIHGYVSIASPSALELLSGLIIALGMMAMALLVLCVLIK